MGRLVVLVTSPRLPAGLLSGTAWSTLRDASLIAAQTTRSPLAAAVVAEGLVVEATRASAEDLLRLSAGRQIVWLAAEDGDVDLMRQLAAAVVSRAETGVPGPDVEVLVGSFDPPGSRLLDLVEVMDRLRADCPWDREQTHESLVRYLVEETYETVEAIETGDREHLREELGDLLLQVIFHARMAQEHLDEPFDIDDVAEGIVDKLIRRHPHVFGTVEGSDRAAPELTGADGVQSQWDAIKATEKSRTSALDGIPPGLPALSLAAKVLDRTTRTPRPGPQAAPSAEQYTAETLGDALFDLARAAQAQGLDAEQALRSRVRLQMAEVRGREQRATPASSPDRR
jgi:XTP/dITP diphosphohydrolase